MRVKVASTKQARGAVAATTSKQSRRGMDGLDAGLRSSSPPPPPLYRAPQTDTTGSLLAPLLPPTVKGEFVDKSAWKGDDSSTDLDKGLGRVIALLSVPVAELAATDLHVDVASTRDVLELLRRALGWEHAEGGERIR